MRRGGKHENIPVDLFSYFRTYFLKIICREKNDPNNWDKTLGDIFPLTLTFYWFRTIPWGY
jgi:hypothetical protein